MAGPSGNALRGYADASRIKTHQEHSETVFMHCDGTSPGWPRLIKFRSRQPEEHMLDYLELKVQEPCTRVALKVVHQSLVYLQEIAEIAPAARFTVRPQYRNLLAELLSQTKPGAEPRQAPRPLVEVLEAIERTVVDYREPVFTRLYAWFYLLQTWCSLRFDDHRDLEPGLLRNSETSLTGVLPRSKTHGPDKRIQRKPIFLDTS